MFTLKQVLRGLFARSDRPVRRPARPRRLQLEGLEERWVPSAAGSLDLTFGTGGVVTTDFGGYDYANAVAVQSDGKIVAGGRGVRNSPTGDFVLARYHADGALDTSFGTGGKVTTSFPLGGNNVPIAEVKAIVIQPDGKIVAAGLAQVKHGTGKKAVFNDDFALARYNSNGTLDSTFGTGGKVTLDFAGNDHGRALAIQADGKLVVAGSGSGRFALARYKMNGTLDTTFDGDGKLTTDTGTTGGGAANAVVIQPDGRIIAGGTVSGDEEFGLVRYMPNGALDSSFGVGGRVVTLFPVVVGEQGHAGALYSLALEADGQIVAAGDVHQGLYPDGSAEFGFAVARYNVDGTLDTTFGIGGTVTTDLDNEGRGRSMAIQADGKIVVGGSSSAGAAIVRYNSDGTLDTSFDNDGIVITSVMSSARGVVLHPSDGDILIAGGSGGNMAVARFYA